jgi:hypothetical protein
MDVPDEHDCFAVSLIQEIRAVAKYSVNGTK